MSFMLKDILKWQFLFVLSKNNASYRNIEFKSSFFPGESSRWPIPYKRLVTITNRLVAD